MVGKFAERGKQSIHKTAICRSVECTYVVSERLFHAGDVREHIIQRRDVCDQRFLIGLRYIHVYTSPAPASHTPTSATLLSHWP